MRLLPIVLLAACVAPAEPAEGVVEQGLRCSDPDFCGTNSNLMTVYGMWELNVRGWPNRSGFTVLGLGKANHFFGLEVRDSRIVGTDAGGRVVLEGPDLAGARIYLQLRNGTQSAIAITDVGAVPEVVGGGRLESYVLDWGQVVANPLPGMMAAGSQIELASVPVLGGTSSVCAEPKWMSESYVGSMVEWDETIANGMLPYQALVFEGDRFDPATRTVDPTPDDDWFNIGCGTSTLAKLRLTRNTLHTAPGWTHVQAALKMLGADYCGGGTSFTFPGEPLVWRDRAGMTYLNLHAGNELEARWDEHGAICVNAPRLANSHNPQAAATYPDVWLAIEEECVTRGKVLRTCKDADPLKWMTSAELVTSANYD